MNLLLNAEQEVLLASIKANNNWGILFVPEEKFYQTLYEIMQNSEDTYKDIMEELISTLKRYPYQDVRRVVSKL